MTLSAFPPPQLDAFALRLLDVAALVRKMAVTARTEGMEGFQLHGNKAHEWLTKLEDWAGEADLRMRSDVLRLQGAARARSAETTATRSPRAKRGRKKRERV